MRLSWLSLLLIVAGLAVYYWVSHREEAVSVEVAPATWGKVSESLDEDGLVRSDVEVALRPQITGRLQRYYVRSGDKVKPGQLVAALDPAEAQAALEQAQAQEAVARAAVLEAEAALTALRQRTAAEIDNAQAARQQSYYSYRKTQTGARPEELGRAAALLSEAEARLQDAERDHRRKSKLVSAGAISKRELEASETQHRVAQAALEQARQSLLMLQRGTRWEEKGVAQADLQRTQAQVRMAQAQREQIEVSQRQYESARRRVETASAEVRRTQAVIDKGVLRSPTTGIVDLENYQVGDSVSLNTTVARVVDANRIWVEVLVDEADRGKVKVGQAAEVVCDAYPGESFPGTIQRIDSVAFLKRELRNTPTQDEDRVFRARVNVQGAQGKLYPGMSVFAEIVLSQHDRLLTIPRQALIQREGKWIAYVDRGGRAQLRTLKVGRRDASSAEVLEGIKEGEQVVVNPIRVEDGKLLQSRPVEAPTSGASATPVPGLRGKDR